MTSPVDPSTCKYLCFRPDSDSKSATKIPVYGYLVFEDECPVENHTFPLDIKNFTIGRVKESHLRVMTAITSRVHCIISCDQNEAPVLFNKSDLNRTYVNDERIETSVKLIDGASIKIGQHVFKFKAIETNSSQEDTIAGESTLEDDIGEEPEVKHEKGQEEKKDEQHEENKENGAAKHDEKMDEEIEVKNETNPVKRNGRKINVRNTGKKTAKKVKEPEPVDEPMEEENESDQAYKKDDANESGHGNESDGATPLSASEENCENEDMSAHASASEEKSDLDVSPQASAAEEKDEDEDGSISVSANEEKNEEASPPLRLRSKNTLKVTFKPTKEAKKSQPVQSQSTSDAVRRSSRRRQNAPTQTLTQTSEPIVEEETPEEPKRTKTTKKAAVATRRKKAVVEEEEATKEVEEKVVQEENIKPRRGRKPKVQVQVEEVSDDSTITKPTTRRTRARK